MDEFSLVSSVFCANNGIPEVDEQVGASTACYISCTNTKTRQLGGEEVSSCKYTLTSLGLYIGSEQWLPMAHLLLGMSCVQLFIFLFDFRSAFFYFHVTVANGRWKSVKLN